LKLLKKSAQAAKKNSFENPVNPKQKPISHTPAFGLFVLYLE